MNKITVGQSLNFTNIYVPIYIENEFQIGDCWNGSVDGLLHILRQDQLNCEILYIRNVDGGHRKDFEKDNCAIVLGIADEDFEKYFR